MGSVLSCCYCSSLQIAVGWCGPSLASSSPVSASKGFITFPGPFMLYTNKCDCLLGFPRNLTDLLCLPVACVPSSHGSVLGAWEVRWDGSFSSGNATVGITLGITRECPLLRAGVLVQDTDASQAEALGSTLAYLLLAAAAPRARGRVAFARNSQAIVDLLHWSDPTEDLLMFNCCELVTNVLQGWRIWAVRALCSESV